MVDEATDVDGIKVEVVGTVDDMLTADSGKIGLPAHLIALHLRKITSCRGHLSTLFVS